MVGASQTVRLANTLKRAHHGSNLGPDDYELAVLWPDASPFSPHQFRTRNDLTESRRTRSIRNENAGKPTKLIVILPLITVWLQVRVLPGPPVISAGYQILVLSSPDHAPETRTFVTCLYSSVADNVTLLVRSDHGVCFSIVDSVVSSHETAKQRSVPLSLNGPSTVDKLRNLATANGL